MRYIILLLFCVLPFTAYGDDINLTSGETLSPPVATKVDWRIALIDAKAKKLVVRYSWLAASGEAVNVGGRETHDWVCRDIPTPGENASCISAGVPFPCCTGAGTGTCDGLDDNCFSAIFGFSIRSQDVGTQIGVGLRQLIFNQWKQDRLSPGNDGTFE